MPLQTRSGAARIPPLLKRGRTRSSPSPREPGSGPELERAAQGAPWTPNDVPAKETSVVADQSGRTGTAAEIVDKHLPEDGAGSGRLTPRKRCRRGENLLESPIALSTKVPGAVPREPSRLDPVINSQYTYTYHSYLAVPIPATMITANPDIRMNHQITNTDRPAASFLPHRAQPHQSHQAPIQLGRNSHDESPDALEHLGKDESNSRLPLQVQAQVEWARDVAAAEAEEVARALQRRKKAGRQWDKIGVREGAMVLGGSGPQGKASNVSRSGLLVDPLDSGESNRASSSGEVEHVVADLGRWRTIRFPGTIYRAEPRPSCRSYTYQSPPLTRALQPLDPIPNLVASGTRGQSIEQGARRAYRARGVAELAEFGHASRNESSLPAVVALGLEDGSVRVTPEEGLDELDSSLLMQRKRKRPAMNVGLDLYHDSESGSSAQDSSSLGRDHETLLSVKCFPNDVDPFPPESVLHPILDPETDDLPNFEYWDEVSAIGGDQDEVVPLLDGSPARLQSGREREEASLEVRSDRLDLRRPSDPLGRPDQDGIEAQDEDHQCDQTTRTEFTTQADQSTSFVGSPDALATGDVPEETQLNDRRPDPLDAGLDLLPPPANKPVKGALRPMPQRLSGLALPTLPMEAVDITADRVEAKMTGRGRGRGRGRVGTRGRRAGGAVAGAQDPLARVRRTETVVGSRNEEIGGVEHGHRPAPRAGAQKRKMPLKAALSPFRLGDVVEEGLGGPIGYDGPGGSDVTGTAEEANFIDNQPMVEGPDRVESPERMTIAEEVEFLTKAVVGRMEFSRKPDTWDRLQGLLPVPHTVPVNPAFTPDRYAISEDYPFVAPPEGSPHPFHPNFARLSKTQPYMRVKWIIPIEGEVRIPNLSSSKIANIEDETARRKTSHRIPAYLPSPACVDFEQDELVGASREGSEEAREGLTPKTIKWTARFLLEFWHLLLKLRKLGRYGQISFALSGPQPDPYATHAPQPALHEHLHVQRSAPNEHLPPPARPHRPLLGIHIKLFCDLTWALKVRLVIASIRFGTNDSFLKNSIPSSGMGESAMEGAGAKLVRARTLFALRKLCLLGERGEVLLVA